MPKLKTPLFWKIAVATLTVILALLAGPMHGGRNAGAETRQSVKSMP